MEIKHQEKKVMDYMNLVLGVILMTVFIWLLYRNRNRSGFIQSWLAIETIVGIIAGVYLVFTSVHSLLIH
ncbi:MAG: hypothetical protein C0490_05305 [Marivirga sp.]|nr:hypothetical protein [Marivirga sp.]